MSCRFLPSPDPDHRSYEGDIQGTMMMMTLQLLPSPSLFGHQSSFITALPIFHYPKILDILGQTYIRNDKQNSRNTNKEKHPWRSFPVFTKPMTCKLRDSKITQQNHVKNYNYSLFNKEIKLPNNKTPLKIINPPNQIK